MSFQGEIGSKTVFKYHIPTARYYVDGCDPYHLDLTESGEKEAIDFVDKPESINLNEHKNDEFETEGDTYCPF